MTSNQKLELTWLGKGEQPRLEPRLLLLEPEHCHGDPNAENILIHGDNLLALKALEQQYAGKVKCIYIDPPYNTGSAFTHYDDMVEHSLWLSLIQKRLEILRRLLSPDGSIWISIDDNECHYLKVVCDEIFGRGNFVANIVWQKAYTSNQTAKHISNTHDHILVFSKDFNLLKLGKIERTEDQISQFKNPDNDPRGKWKAENLSAGKYYSAGQFEIMGPKGQSFLPPKGRFWRCNQEQYNKWLNDNRITFGLSNEGRPMLKRFLSEINQGLTPNTWWSHEEAGSNKEASIDIKNLFKEKEEDVFQTPKPEKLIKRIFEISTCPGDLVLDSFLGSGTTAAVAHKMNRRWIGIELGEHCYTHCVPRLRKVVSGEDQGGISKVMDWKGGGGFKTYRLAPSLLATDEHAMLRFNPDFTDDMVAEAVAKIEGFSYAPDPEVFWKQSRSSEQDYLLVTKIFVTAEWLAQLHEQMAEEESLLLCCPAYGDGCERAFPNITLKKIPNAFMRKYEFGKDDYSLNVQNVIGGNEEEVLLEDDLEEETTHESKPRSKKGKVDDQPTLF